MLKTLKIELLKIKRSKIFFVATLFPMIAIIQGIGFAQNMKGKEGMEDIWMLLFSNSVLIYGLLIFPMLVTIIIAMITRIEHSNNGWKGLLSLPLKRKDVYLSKLLLGCGILLYNIVILSTGIIASGIVFGASRPIPFDVVLLRPILAFIAALPIISLQFYLSMRFKNAGIPLGVGALSILPTILVANSTKYWIFYPWTYPMLTMMPHFITSSDQTMKYSIMYGVSIISFIMIIGMGLLQFNKKDIL